MLRGLFFYAIFCIFALPCGANDLYKKPSKFNPLELTVKNNEIIATNKNPRPVGPIIPLFSQIYPLDRKILVDTCSFYYLKPGESCSIKLSSLRKINLDFMGYNQKETLASFSDNFIPDKILELPNYISLDKIRVEKLGVGSKFKIPLKIKSCNFTKNYNLTNYWASIESDSNCILNFIFYPKKEDVWDEEIYFSLDSINYKLPFIISSIARRPQKIKIINEEEKIQIGYKLNLITKAHYSLGVPKEEILDNNLVNYLSGSSEVSSSFIGETESSIEVIANFLSFKSEAYKVKIISAWADNSTEDLIVTKNKELDASNPLVFRKIIIKKGVLLTLKSSNPQIFIGAKEVIINGSIRFSTNLTGDFSINKINFDGSLTGPRLLHKSPQGREVGGLLYIKAKSFKGEGKVDLLSNGAFFLEAAERAFTGNILGFNNPLEYQYYFAKKPIIPESLIQQVTYNPWQNIVKTAWIGSLLSVFRYLVTAVIAFIILYLILYRRILKFKIQKDFPQKKIIIKEISFSLVSASVINFLVALLVTNPLKEFGILKIYTDPQKYGLFYYFFSFILIIILHDIYFYFTHRLLHTSWLYKKVHSVHHSSVNPTPLTALSFHPIEAFLHFSFMPLVSLIPFHYDAISFFLWAMLIFNVNGHSGYEYFPKFLKSGIFRIIFTNSTHHNLHHKDFKYNYGLYFNLLDYFLKTEHPKYEEKLK